MPRSGGIAVTLLIVVGALVFAVHSAQASTDHVLARQYELLDVLFDVKRCTYKTIEFECGKVRPK
jgi:hypothetical protein